MANRIRGLLGDTVHQSSQLPGTSIDPVIGDWHSQLPGSYINPFTGEINAQKNDPQFLWVEPNDMTQDNPEGNVTGWVPRDRAIGLLGLT